ncbi:MAG: globin [Pleurocapsa minor GSE-CHR-MK-17-07R]|jgi:hemoglobin|nr:globin [Pleurocapsa minor GSE-CHR-MK 17-07R]
MSLYEMVGGMPTFKTLVDAFYARVEADDRLRSMFPDDLEPGKRYQMLFLAQYFGGPTDYDGERGHPRLRMRHMPFAIDHAAQSAWLEHMLAAIDIAGIQEPMRGEMRAYFTRGSEFMINRFPENPANAPAAPTESRS